MVHYLAQDPRVGSVTALTRRARDDAADLFDLSSAADAAKVTFRVVDFDALADSGAGAEAVKVRLCQPRPAVIARACVFVCVCVCLCVCLCVCSAVQSSAVQCSPVQCSAVLAGRSFATRCVCVGVQGHSIGASCLGIYTKDARDEAHFRRVEIGYNTAVARALVAGGGTRFAYLSGMGAKAGGWAMFARVKADAEAALRNVSGIVKSASMRPGYIAHRPGASLGIPDRIAGFMPGVMKKLGMGVECDDIAKTMVHSLLAPAADVADVFENKDIMATARVYEKELAGHETCA